MTVWLKQGVCGGLSPQMRRCKGRLIDLYQGKGLDFFITSKGDSNHMSSSCHYEGDAMDFKRGGISKKEIIAVCGEGFDVVEYPELDIFHVEYDPKG